MSDKLEERMMAKIPSMNSVEELRRVLKNSKQSSPDVYRTAFSRFVEVSAQSNGELSPLALACWEMVHTIEEIRREAGRVWRMNHLRPKINKDGERAALEYCARNHTDGFDEVISYGLPQFTAEAIVLKFSNEYPDEALRDVARKRLSAAGVDPAQFEVEQQ